MSCKGTERPTNAVQEPPENWLSCPRHPESVLTIYGINNKFYAFKTPLDSKYYDVPKKYCWDPHTMLDYAYGKGFPIGLCIDLTNTDRYYDKKLVEDQGCQYFKIKCAGFKGPPSLEDVQNFISKCSTFVAEYPNSHIGVHCTHGHNRTGFMIVSYLVTAHQYSVEKAISKFAISRPPGIYKRGYILELFKRYGGIGVPPPAPPLPGWHTQTDGVAARIRTEIAALTGFSKWRFPGCQPVSMNRLNIKLLKNGYRVSAKADGTRYLMYIAEAKRVFFIDRNNNVFNMYDHLSFPSAQDPSNHLFKTLVDGEMVIDSSQGKDFQRFLMYDIILLNGVNVGGKPFDSDNSTGNCDVRYNLIEKEIIGPREKAMDLGRIDRTKEPIGISRKIFRKIDTSTITELLSIESPYRLDGLVFQPIKDPYNTGPCYEVLKWKPASQNSVDFRLKITNVEDRPGEETYELLLGEYPTHICRPPLAKADYKKVSNLDGKLIECYYESGEWKFIKERTDKSFPNSYKTAKAVFKSIKEPVDEDDLKKFVEEIANLKI